MRVSVILCTYNRCESLERTLDSITRLSVPEAVEWEILVVDNNSSDHTRETVQVFCSRYPRRFRYLFEPKQGKSYALNAGVREARGEVLAFMDDDELVDPLWLHHLTSGLHNHEWAGAGGKVIPTWSQRAPRWLLPGAPYTLGPLVHFDLGDEAGPLAENPIGANMAFRKAMFEKYGGFRTDLGPRPGSGDPQKSEDSEFGVRLLAAGERLRYEPSAVIYHPVPEHRIKKSYFIQWWFDKARADIRAYGVPRDASFYFTGIPLYLFRRLVVWTLKWILAINPARRFSNKLNVCIIAGQILECHRVAVSGNTASVSSKNAENYSA